MKWIGREKNILNIHYSWMSFRFSISHTHKFQWDFHFFYSFFFFSFFSFFFRIISTDQRNNTKTFHWEMVFVGQRIISNWDSLITINATIIVPFSIHIFILYTCRCITQCDIALLLSKFHIILDSLFVLIFELWKLFNVSMRADILDCMYRAQRNLKCLRIFSTEHQ